MSATQTQTSARAAPAHELEQVERVFARQDLVASAEVHARARRLALEAREGFEDPHEAAQAATLVLARRLFDAFATDLASDPRVLGALVQRLHPVLGVSREMLAYELLSLSSAPAPAPAVAVKTALGLLVGLAPVSGTSLWRRERAGAVRLLDRAGSGAESDAARALARRLLAGEDPAPGARTELIGLALQERGQLTAALVARSEPARRAQARASMRVLATPLQALLERDAQMTRNASDERALVAGGERRLLRLGFDLHDGPLQELLLLGEDLRLFRQQLGDVLGQEGKQRLLRGRLDDLDARLVALEGGLRRISTSVHASVALDRPFDKALQDVLDAFTARSPVVPELRLHGEADGISPSQRIALLSVVGEALNNVREHAPGATAVRVEIGFDARGVSARVVDDGSGFDVEAALVSAARRGRMGLAGIHERVRLLGGVCVVDSRPGGPTAVALSLPRWEPLAGASPRRRATDAAAVGD
ncbi:MAG TPA: ATP-binding protein [Solirubrobacteraceae bacterium]|jgi:signal transduction histidine kinase|nr:ATP-binding protein [Solirubrobacteraceae bacterium]